MTVTARSMRGTGWAARTAMALLAVALVAVPCVQAAASTAWGTINNFDCVNDTGVECHGFEIEIEDIRARDITYTYDWNHYGTPKICEDLSNPLHPKVIIRYESPKRPDGSWAAYTAIPSGPIAPTDGHRFTDPSVNFGGEHFGVGYYGTPTAIRYSWLKDDGFGNLVFAGAVNVGTPVFGLYAAGGGFPARVQAAIEPPPPPEPPVREFGEPSWVKEIRTTSHNNHKVELRDLVTDDPDDPNDENWKNGEPDEVEVEWQLLQTDFNSGDGGPNGELVGAPEDLPNGDEVVTRRYEFFKYVGPVDPETGEALADKVGPDGIHGVGVKIINGVEVDLSTVVVVGDFIGSQMAGFDPAARIGLIDHLQDGEVGSPYVERRIVIGGTAPIVTTRDGALPPGMTFDVVTGILSGTPTAPGTYSFTISSVDALGDTVANTYRLTIVEAGQQRPPHADIKTVAAPLGGGTTTGDGEYAMGAIVTVTATPNPGCAFVNWTDGGTVVSENATFEFEALANRELVANFASVGGSTQITNVQGGPGMIGQKVTLAGTLSNAADASPVAGAALKFAINGAMVGSALTDATGRARLTFKIPASLGVGTQALAVQYDGDATHLASSGSGTLTTNAATTAIVNLSIPPGRIGQKVTLKGTLKRTTDGAPLPGQSITFKVAGTAVGTKTTSSTGVVSLAYTIPESLGVGKRTVRLSFAGSTLYLASSKSGTLTVSKGLTTLAVPPVSGAAGATVTLTATLKTSTGTVLAGRTVSFSVGGTGVGSAVTDAAGVATVMYTIPSATPSGTVLSTTAAFPGDALYAPVTNHGTLTVSP